MAINLWHCIILLFNLSLDTLFSFLHPYFASLPESFMKLWRSPSTPSNMKTPAIQLDKLKREPASLSSKKSDSARTPFIHRAHDPSRHHAAPSVSVSTGISLKQAVTLSEASRPRSPSASGPAVTLRGRDPAIGTPQSTARATKVGEHGKVTALTLSPHYTDH
jgi:hypothetical protein